MRTIYVIKRDAKLKGEKESGSEVPKTSILWANNTIEDAKRNIKILTESSEYDKQYEKRYYIEEVILYD